MEEPKISYPDDNATFFEKNDVQPAEVQHLTVRLTRHGDDCRVWMNGQDITAPLISIKIEASAGQFTKTTLEFYSLVEGGIETALEMKPVDLWKSPIEKPIKKVEIFE